MSMRTVLADVLKQSQESETLYMHWKLMFWQNVAERAIVKLKDRGYVIIPIPRFDHRGPDDTVESTCRRAAANLYNGYDVGGSNTRAGVARLLEGVAEELK